MNLRQQFPILFLFTLALGLLSVSMDLAAGPLKVKSASPNFGTQGDTPFPVVIKGQGFTNANRVKFLVNNSTNTGGVGVDLISVDDDETITVQVNIPLGATIGDYDIEVQLNNGRKGKGTTLFSVKQIGGGNQHPTFDVTFHGDLEGSDGTKWQSSTSQDSITYFLVDQQGGTGDMNMSYFQLPFPAGPFTGAFGANCFNQLTPIEAVQFYRDNNGVAIVKGSFTGYSEDGTMTFVYLITLNGFFDNPGDWLPQVSTTVTITGWKLKLKSKREDKRYSNITCTGDGSFFSDTYIEVERNSP